MFSRKEREYLELVASGATPEDSSLSTGYRRKLRWEIRRKASTGFADWELYLSAAERDSRLAAGTWVDGGPVVPVYTEPFVTMVRAMRARIGRLSQRSLQRKPKGG